MRQTLTQEGFANIFANFLGAGLEQLVEKDGAGQVYGVADLPMDLLVASCNNLRIRSGFADAWVLSDEAGEQAITPEELNSRVAGDPDAHMVVFLPDEMMARAEAVFPPAFFTPVDVFRSLEIIEEQIISRINSVPLYKRVAAIWAAHAAERIPILKRIDFLVNVVSLCLPAEEMGAFFHKLDLIPDRSPDLTGNFADRLARNAVAVTILCNPEISIPERVAALRLDNTVLAARLVTLIESLDDVTPEALTDAIFAAENTGADAGLAFEHWRFAGEPGAACA